MTLFDYPPIAEAVRVLQANGFNVTKTKLYDEPTRDVQVALVGFEITKGMRITDSFPGGIEDAEIIAEHPFIGPRTNPVIELPLIRLKRKPAKPTKPGVYTKEPDGEWKPMGTTGRFDVTPEARSRNRIIDDMLHRAGGYYCGSCSIAPVTRQGDWCDVCRTHRM